MKARADKGHVLLIASNELIVNELINEVQIKNSQSEK